MTLVPAILFLKTSGRDVMAFMINSLINIARSLIHPLMNSSISVLYRTFTLESQSNLRLNMLVR